MVMTMEAAEPSVVSQTIESKADQAIQEPDNESEPLHFDSDGLSTEPDSPVDDTENEEHEGEGAEDAIPDGDSNADLHALLAYSKSRLQNQPVQEARPPSVVDDEPAEVTDDDDTEQRETANDAVADDSEIRPTHSEEEQLAIARAKIKEAEAKAAADDDEMEALREEARLLAEAKAKADSKLAEEEQSTVEENPAHLLKLAEQKVKEAEAKARKDEEETGENVLKVSTSKRSDANSELWALLNYSKMRLETGATPQIGKKRDSVRGDDVSVSSKGTKKSISSKTSKKSIASQSVASCSKAPVFVVEGLDGSVKNEEECNKTDGETAPFPDVTGEVASVDGSVSGDDEQESFDESDEENSGESESEEEEEDELPSFLQDDDDREEDIDPEEAKRLYEEAKFKAASILSVAEKKLTEVQMLQAMAIAEEAAKNGDENFSTKRSLFRLNEAKLEDLKSFLDFSEMKKGLAAELDKPAPKHHSEQVPWGIGGGRLMKKMGAAFQDLKDRCNEIDERKLQQRKGTLTHTEMFNAAFDDLRKQIDEYEKIVKGRK